MKHPFDTDGMAAGYATSRPPVHPLVIQQVFRCVARSEPVRRALDIGCGAGLSTKALNNFADYSIGIEPSEAMLRWAATIAPRSDFVIGRAEAIPFREKSIDLITAAGSLNYADLDLFFPEAARVLTPKALLVVYDFLPGRRFRDAAGLDEWFSNFTRRYPWPLSEARTLSPEILAQLDSGFRVHTSHNFDIGITLTPDFYLDYIMTETNVAAAMRSGAAQQEIKSWCAETLRPIWGGRAREVRFSGYFACMTKA